MIREIRNNQTGYTLIELMIGMAVGLIVLSGALFLYLQIFNVSKATLASTQLNRELSILLDTMSGEIRRHGYSASSTGGPYQASSSAGLSVAGSCILYGYDVDADGTQDDNESRGFMLAAGKVLFAKTASAACGSTANWIDLTSLDAVSVSDLNFSLNIDSATTGSTTSYTRTVGISITASDPNGSVTSSKDVTVLIPNNVVEN